MALDNLLEQISQVEGDITNVATVEAEIENISHIDGEIGNIIPIDISSNYKGEIKESDWYQIGKYWYYDVPHTTHKLINPFVNKFLVATEQGYDNAIYSYTVFANRDLSFRSSMPVNCQYNITGER